MYKITIWGNATEWCYYCWKNYLDMHPQIKFYKYSFPLPFMNSYIYRILFKIYNPLGRGVCLRPIIRIIIQTFLKFDKHKKNILVIYDWNELATDSKFMSHLRKRYPNMIIVYVFTNIVKFTGAKEWGILLGLNSYYDAVFAFDKVDAQKYNFRYLPLIYAQETRNQSPCEQEDIDIFYVGKAKDRLDIIHKIYHKAKSEGLVCDFNIIDVPEEIQKYKGEINYNHKMPYNEVIKKIRKSKCLLDVIQGESTGLTIKVVESVIYSKKLITTNPNVFNEIKSGHENILLYDEQFSLKDFVVSDRHQYDISEVNYFSPDLFINGLITLYETKRETNNNSTYST